MTARQRFAQAVRSGGGAAKVAPLLGCSRTYVDLIIAGKRSPGIRMAYAIEQRFGLRMQAWVEDGAAESAPEGGGQ